MPGQAEAEVEVNRWGGSQTDPRFLLNLTLTLAYLDALRALTRRVKREIRRDAVLGFITPLVTALLSAEVAFRNAVVASETCFWLRAATVFLMRPLM